MKARNLKPTTKWRHWRKQLLCEASPALITPDYLCSINTATSIRAPAEWAQAKVIDEQGAKLWPEAKYSSTEGSSEADTANTTAQCVHCSVTDHSTDSRVWVSVGTKCDLNTWYLHSQHPQSNQSLSYRWMTFLEQVIWCEDGTNVQLSLQKFSSIKKDSHSLASVVQFL